MSGPVKCTDCDRVAVGTGENGLPYCIDCVFQYM